MLFSELAARCAVALMLLLGAIFTHFESLYLRDQAAEIGASGSNIVMWMWVFRFITIAFGGLALTLAYTTIRRYMS